MNVVIKNITMVLPDHSMLKSDLYISGSKIVGIGTPPPKFYAWRTLDGSYKFAVPGFINTHTHAYMSVFRNWADDLDFNTWLFKRIMPAEDKLVQSIASWSSVLSCMEMLKSGITTFVDMHMFPECSAFAATQCGMKAVISRGLAGGEDDKDGGTRRIREALDEYEKFKELPNLKFMLAPHAPYSCDEDYLREIAALSDDLNLGIHTHLSESQDEVHNCKNKYQATPIQLFDRCGLLKESTIAAHCVHLTSEDIEILADRHVNVSLNTTSNLKLGNGVAPAKSMQDAGINLCLGTDGASSNNSLNMLREMQFVTLVQKGFTHDPEVMNASDVFDMATINGAKAVGMEDRIGKIEVGYDADIAIFDTQDPAFTPIGNPIAALCYSSAGITADTVICNGKIVIENKHLVSLDYDYVKRVVIAGCYKAGIDVNPLLNSLLFEC